MKKPLPTRRKGYNQKFILGEYNIFLRTGEYEDGTLGEIFCTIRKDGHIIQALVNAFCISLSIGLQHGIPLEEFAEKFINSKYDPCGVVQGHEYISTCTSIMDLIMRDLSINYLEREDLKQKGGVVT